MKERIFVVDDDPNLLELVRLFLEKTKRFEVRVENRPSRAIFTAREFRPDLIILDVNMPGKDGGELARAFKEDATTRGTPILFLTSLISAEEAGTHEVNRGGMPFLAKPVNPTMLIEAIDRILDRQQHSPGEIPQRAGISPTPASQRGSGAAGKSGTGVKPRPSPPG